MSETPLTITVKAADLPEVTALVQRLTAERDQADAVAAETKRLMARRTTTLRERAERAEAQRDQAREMAVALEQQNARALQLLRQLNPERIELRRVIAVLAGDCERHPDAPTIGGACGMCTQYPSDFFSRGL